MYPPHLAGSAARRLDERELAGSSVAELDVEEAYAQHAMGVRRFLGRLGLRGAEVEDAASETFLVAYEKRSEFDSTRPVRPWLLGIAAKLAKRTQRRRWVRRLLSLKLERQELPLAQAKDPLAAMLEEEDVARVRRAMDRMSERKRTLLVLREYEGLSAEEIGYALGLPEATVYSALHYARKELVKNYRREMLMEAVR